MFKETQTNWSYKVFSEDLSLSARMAIGLGIALISVALLFLLYKVTGFYIHTLTIFTVVLISLFSGLLPGIVYSIILSLVIDYSFIPPIGSILDNANSVEHFLINTTLSIFISAFMSTLRITYRNMIKAKQEAEQANRLKTNFLATISHEIRTPLNGIIGLSDVLRHMSLSEDARHHSELIHQSGKTLLKILNDILDYAKVESGQIELEMSNFSIQDVVEQVVSTLRPKAAQKKLHLQFSIDENTPKAVYGDSSRLSQVLFNLIGNAIKFTHTGGVIIKVRPEAISSTEKVVCITFSVTDSGVGIASELQKKLFQPFVQLHKVGTSGESGTGLGLSICRRILRTMNSEIYVESKKDEGSRFFFSLKFSRFSEEKIGKPNALKKSTLKEAPSPLQVLFSESNRPTILVVDDNPTNQITAQVMLEKIGAHVILGSNGSEAIALLKQTRIDLILMDCQMPVMDGFEATEKIRDLNYSLPIVAMTANASEDDQIACLASGMNAIITKPLTFEQLKAELVRNLNPIPSYISESVLKRLTTTIGAAGCSKVIEAFLTGFTEMQQQLVDPDLKSNLDKIHKLGHRYKSSTETVGAIGLSNLFKQLEHTETLSQSEKIITEIAQNYHDVERQLKHYLPPSGLEK